MEFLNVVIQGWEIFLDNAQHRNGSLTWDENGLEVELDSVFDIPWEVLDEISKRRNV